MRGLADLGKAYRRAGQRLKQSPIATREFIRIAGSCAVSDVHRCEPRLARHYGLAKVLIFPLPIDCPGGLFGMENGAGLL